MELDTITLGNAYELIKGIPDKSVDLIVTDPPYLMSYSGAGLMKTRVKHMKEAMDARTDTLLNGINEDILGEFMRIMKEPNIYIWCNKKQIVGYLDYFHKRHGCLFDFIIWGKDNPVPFTSNGYLKDKEYCLFFRKGAKVYGDYDTKHTVYMTHVNAQGGEEYGHPTMKPLHIIKNLIENSSVRGGLVCDPFMGSGTTAVACKELGRHYIGFEIDEGFHRMANDRVNGITPKERKSGNIQLKLDI